MKYATLVALMLIAGGLFGGTVGALIGIAKTAEAAPAEAASVIDLKGERVPGLWVTNTSGKSKGMVAIYNSDTQGPVIGLYSADALKNVAAMTVAIALDQKGKPCIQVVGDDKQVRSIDLGKLARMVESCKCPDCCGQKQ